jgi:diguanylate cyclase (GGDEF)-like protein/PAS domain S-box-containing protein
MASDGPNAWTRAGSDPSIAARLLDAFARTAVERLRGVTAFVWVREGPLSRRIYCDRASNTSERDAYRSIAERFAATGQLTPTAFDEGGHRLMILPLLDDLGALAGVLCVRFAPVTAVSLTVTDADDALRCVGAALSRVLTVLRNAPYDVGAQIALLEEAVAHVADPIAIFRRGEAGTMPHFVYVNDAFTELFGYTLADVVDKEPHILTGPETGTAPREKILSARGEAPVDYGTIALYTASGERRDIIMITHGLTRVHRIVSYRDVTRERTAQRALENGNQRLASLIAHNSDAILTFDRAGTCVEANPAAEAVTGYRRTDILRGGLRNVAPDGLFPDGDRFPEKIAEGESLVFTTTIRHRDGRRLAIECRAIPIVVCGKVEGAYLFAKDVTEEQRLAMLVRKQSERAAALCAVAAASQTTNTERIDASLGLVLQSFEADYVYIGEVSGLALRITRSLGTRPREERGTRNISAPLHVDGRVIGSIGCVSSRAEPYDSADRDFLRLVATFVSNSRQRRDQNLRLDRLAFYDELTSIPNRTQFTRVLAKEIAERETFALHFIDIDGFKALNDRAGHAVGDLALREIGRRLGALCRRGETPARLGGDEFVVIQPNAADGPAASAFAASILQSLARPHEAGGSTFVLGASIGVALYPRDGDNADALMRSADEALYRAKTTGKHRVEVVGMPQRAALHRA